MNDQQFKQSIVDALHGFATNGSAQNAIKLFNSMDYDSEKRPAHASNAPSDFINDFDLSGKFNASKGLLDRWQSIDLLFQLTGDEIKTSSQLMLDFGVEKKVDNAIIESYLFFALDLQDERYTRTQLASITREINKLFPMPAMILFRHGQTLTLSIINRRLHKRDESKDVLEKVTLIKDIDFTNPHRAHIEILFDLSLNEVYQQYSFTNFVELHNAWQKVLDSSELNKRFFKEVANWYFWAMKHVTFPKDAGDDIEVRNATSLIRLITRLIFIWFVKEKGLVPDNLFDQRKLEGILDYSDPKGTTYYKAILQNLFFATLNQEMGKREFRKDGQNLMAHNLFRYKSLFKNPDDALGFFHDIPFLNGGLFECLDKTLGTKEDPSYIRIDGFSDRDDNELCVPDFLLFSEEKEVDLNDDYGTKNKHYKVCGLIDIFNRYKFTIEENTPIEEEIALDPELLGKVFENLLANYNPETKATARKQTGSYYTPREIVNYMVDESLIAYFETQLSKRIPALEDMKDLPDLLREVFAYTEKEHPFNEEEVTALIDAIDSIKILDPACGSAAFPMGILHKLVFILNKLDPNNERWRNKQLAKAAQIPDSTIQEKDIADIDEVFERNEPDYGRKLYLIENCIFGVDIQPIAVQIAKLRFFISLVVDQKIDDTQENRGIRPLPNLETKFVAANTLLGIKKPMEPKLRNPEIDRKEAELAEVRRNHFTARTPRTKAKYRDLDARLRAEISQLLQRDEWFPPDTAKILAHWDPYDQNASADFFDPEWMFGITKGFDVVIANPPYVLLQNLKIDNSKLGTIKQQYESAQYKIDTYHLFIEQGMKLLSRNGVLSYITPNTFLKNKYTNKLRKIIVERTLVRDIVLFYVKVFEDPSVDNLVVVCTKKEQGECPEHRIRIHEVKTSNFSEQVQDARLFPQQDIKPEEYLFEFGMSEDVKGVIEKLKSGSIEFGEIGRAYFGIQTFDRKRFVSRERRSQFFQPVIDGVNIHRYRIDPPSEFVEFKPTAIKSGGDPNVYKRKRIVVRQIGEYPVGAICPSSLYTLNTIYNLLIDRPEYDLRYVLAILNSNLMRFFWLAKFYDNKATFPKIKKRPLESIPIKIADEIEQHRFADLVNRIISPNSSDTCTIDSPKKAQLEDYERQIDKMVYELYNLTQKEIGIVEQTVGHKK